MQPAFKTADWLRQSEQLQLANCSSADNTLYSHTGFLSFSANNFDKEISAICTIQQLVNNYNE